jgi:hypothetical protein
VLPQAIEREVSVEPAVSRFIRKAGTKIAGKIRYPHNITAAMAKPVGAQIGVTLGWVEANLKQRNASTK